jgi:hypothetical protein
MLNLSAGYQRNCKALDIHLETKNNVGWMQAISATRSSGSTNNSVLVEVEGPVIPPATGAQVITWSAARGRFVL